MAKSKKHPNADNASVQLLIVVLLVVFFPIGLIAMWVEGVWSLRVRWLLTALALIPIAFAFVAFVTPAHP